MINDWYRLNMEVVLTANKMNGTGSGTFHDEIIRQIEQQRISSAYMKRASGIRKLWKRLFQSINPAKDSEIFAATDR